jgi:hypothetical protein
MLFRKDHTKEKIEVPPTNPEVDIDNETVPHIKKFERQTEDSTTKQAAVEQSKRIFGPFRQTPRVEKSSFIKSQEKSFLQTRKEVDEQD